MEILSTAGWEEYALLDSGGGMRLEQYGKYRISRPDPQAIWSPKLSKNEWENVDASYETEGGKGNWVRKNPVPERWKMTYKDLSFWARLTAFKHTGVFPEQHLQWDFLSTVIARSPSTSLRINSATKQSRDSGSSTRKTLRPIRRAQGKQEEIATPLRARNDNKVNVLNLFGYTGIASLVCAKAGAAVTHVDASRPAISWARENQELCGLTDALIRWILDDAIKFVQREVRRGIRYDGIIMDPPVYGHGPGGEVWDFQKSFPELMKLCRQVLTDKPLFVIINAYAISASAIMLENVLQETVEGLGGEIESGELALQEKQGERLLSTGIFSRWSTD